MATHSAGNSTWRFVHRVSGETLLVDAHTAQEAMTQNTELFFKAFGELPCWSRLDCWLASESVVNPIVRLVGYERGRVEIREPESLESTGAA